MAHHYGVNIKLIFGRNDGAIFPMVIGGKVVHWHNVEFPVVENKRGDMIGETEDGGLTYLESTSTNDAALPARVGRNVLAARSLFPGRRIRPVVFYVGAEPLRLSSPWKSEFVDVRFEIVDAIDLDPEPLLDSPDIRDKMAALLTRADPNRAIHQVSRSIARMREPERRDYALRFITLGGLRGVERTIMERVESMVTLEDLMRNEVIGPWLRDSRDEGKVEGVTEGERTLLTRLMVRRFGPLSPEALDRLARASKEQLETWGDSIMDARSLDDLLAS